MGALKGNISVAPEQHDSKGLMAQRVHQSATTSAFTFSHLTDALSKVTYKWSNLGLLQIFSHSLYDMLKATADSCDVFGFLCLFL